MSGPFGSSQWMYQSAAGFYPFAIDQSLRFNDNDSAYLSRTPASAGNRKTWTWSGWVKRGSLGSWQYLFGSNVGAAVDGGVLLSNTDNIGISVSGNIYNKYTSAVLRDTSAWYHIVATLDTDNATAADRIKLYINGVEQTNYFTLNIGLPPSGYTPAYLNNANNHDIGKLAGYSQDYFDGYLAEVNFIDGQALDPTSFGEFKSGVWIPKDPSGLTYGTNGFRLSFADSSNIGDDTSGNTNDWTANSLVATDVLLDSPTNNFATLNPLDNYNTGATLSEGNLKWSIGAADGATRSNFVMTSGKWYAEFLPSDYCGVVGIEDAVTDDVNGTPSVWYGSDGNKRISGTVTAYGASYTVASDIIGLALDLDAGEITFYKNNVSQGAITLPSSNGWAIACGSGSGSKTSILNFGQDSSFAGNKTAQGNTDDNGIGDFYYAPPSALALCTANLPDPVIDPAQDDVPSDYFDISLWTGNGTSQSITGLTFQPDFVWIKNRSDVRSNHLQDAVRGATNFLRSNTTDAELTNAAALTAFTSDGFNVGSYPEVNDASDTHVAWSWLAGNGTSSNTDGSITSTVSVNQKAGFSIVSYSPSFSSGQSGTIGHGLGVAPKIVIRKARDITNDWWAFVEGATGRQDDYLALNKTDAVSNAYPPAGRMTSTTFTDSFDYSSTASSVIAYCFAEVEGYSKFGSYTGNGSTDGPFVYTGFRPAWVMVKCTSTASAGSTNWYIHDAARDAYNSSTTNHLWADLSAEENSGSYSTSAYNQMDLLSNGFKLKNTNLGTNASQTYIFMAFAENPFKYANAR